MHMVSRNILVLNFGSTTSKIALFDGGTEIANKTYTHTRQELAGLKTMLDQLPLRCAALRQFLDEYHISRDKIDMIVPRYPMVGIDIPGHLLVDDAFMEWALNRKDTFHIMFITPIVAREVLGDGIPMAICDLYSYQEVAPELEITGIPLIKRPHLGHIENCIAVSRKLASDAAKSPDELSFIYGHLGGGVSFTWFGGGKIRYAVFDGEAGFSPERSGFLPNLPLIDLCYSGKYSKEQATAWIKGNGGLAAHFGTTDCLEIEKRMESGDEQARLVYTAMGIRMAGCIGEAAAIAKGRVDYIVLAGGIANSPYITGIIKERVGFIAPVKVYPGEFETEFFANFGADVLNGTAKTFNYADI